MTAAATFDPECTFGRLRARAKLNVASWVLIACLPAIVSLLPEPAPASSSPPVVIDTAERQDRAVRDARAHADELDATDAAQLERDQDAE